MPIDGLVAGNLIATPGLAKGFGVPDTTAGGFSAGQYNVVPGTLITLPTGLVVGSRFRFWTSLVKTAAGSATWNARVTIGTLGTASDTSVAVFTSGTNTAAIDQAILVVEMVITALGTGTAATAACSAFYCNTLTNATGLGSIGLQATSTAGFNSATAKYIHLDIEPGTAAVMTGGGMAEQLA